MNELGDPSSHSPSLNFRECVDLYFNLQLGSRYASVFIDLLPLAINNQYIFAHINSLILHLVCLFVNRQLEMSDLENHVPLQCYCFSNSSFVFYRIAYFIKMHPYVYIFPPISRHAIFMCELKMHARPGA